MPMIWPTLIFIKTGMWTSIHNNFFKVNSKQTWHTKFFDQFSFAIIKIFNILTAVRVKLNLLKSCVCHGYFKYTLDSLTKMCCVFWSILNMPYCPLYWLMDYADLSSSNLARPFVIWWRPHSGLKFWKKFIYIFKKSNLLRT